MGDVTIAVADVAVAAVAADDKTPSSAFVVSITACARCDLDHPNLGFSLFTKHKLGDYQYWAMCPTLKEPVLLSVQLKNG
jgi:hypothetical protein